MLLLFFHEVPLDLSGNILGNRKTGSQLWRLVARCLLQFPQRLCYEESGSLVSFIRQMGLVLAQSNNLSLRSTGTAKRLIGKELSAE